MWVFVVFFCFKQKTAYEMRISDWSSDVCSSDLGRMATFAAQHVDCRQHVRRAVEQRAVEVEQHHARKCRARESWFQLPIPHSQIGRASCRERVCQYV